MSQITSLDALRAIYPEPDASLWKKSVGHLDKHCLAWIARSPFCVVATVGADGLADATPRGDGPGFAVPLDGERLLLPDRPGNNRLDTLRNIVANPVIGLLFFIPGFDDLLRVNGTAEVRDDEDLRARCAVKGRLPATVIVVRVREAFIHCGKAVIRSRLWDPAALQDRKSFPPLGEIFADHVGDPGVAISEDELEALYQKTLY